MASSLPPHKTTIFDEEISRLEKRRAEVETERQQLLSGQITITGPDGSSLMKIDLGVLSAAANDQKTIERNLRQTLIENPLVPILESSFKKTRELRDELLSRGEYSSSVNPKILSPINRLVRANSHSNHFVHTKSQQLGKVFGSPWLLAIGMVILIIWCGGPLLYTFSGGTIGGEPLGTDTALPSKPTSKLDSPKPTTSSPQTSKPTKPDQVVVENSNFVEKVSYLKQPLKVQAVSDDNKPTLSPSAFETPMPQVGNEPTSTGGLNGPHGAFLAPSRMVVPALGLDTKVERALTQDNNNDGLTLVTWPRPGEVVQTGAYPGEIGNMLLMGNQHDLGALRRIQQNDEVTVYDRKGNAFIYRILPFSADGQTERVIDPASLEDAWIFNPTDTAILTILVTYPQPLPAVDPNQSSSNHNQVTPRDDYLVQKKLAYRGILAMYASAKITPAGTPVVVPAEVWQTVGVPAKANSPASTTQNQNQTEAPTSTQASPAVTPSVVKDNSAGQPALLTPGQTTPALVIPSGFPATGEGGGTISGPPKERYTSK